MASAALVLLWAGVVVVSALRARPVPIRRFDGLLAASSGAAGRGSGWRQGAGGRREDRRRFAAVAAAVPDVVDLFAVAIASSGNVLLATEAVVRAAPPGPLTDELATALDEVASGARLADALARVPDRAGEAVRPLVAALVDAERYGSALGPALDRVADEARRSRQRRGEEAARQVPVKLLFPLVLCVLPAFALLTVAPLIAGGLRSLRP